MTQAFPLQWPAGRPRKPAGVRKPGKFNKKVRKEFSTGGSYLALSALSIADALKRLQSELDMIGARYPVVSTNVEIRLDGLPRSGQRNPEDPGVAVYFQLAGKPHCLPCDTYIRVEHNIAAVAAHIEATRAIERHGVASVSEMFQGFAALPPPPKWFETLEVSGRATRDEISAAYRRLAAKRHPDRPGGSHDAMAALNAASGGDEGAAGASEKEYDYDPVMAAEALTNRIAVGNCETFNLCRSALSDAYDAGRSKAASALSAEREAHERDVRQFSELADANRRRAEAAEADAQAMRAALERSARFVRDELDVRRASMIGPEGTADCPEYRAYIEDAQALLAQIEQALS